MKNHISSGSFSHFPIIRLAEAEKVLEKCQGGNQKKLLVVFRAQDENAERFEFLKKILKAATYDIEQDILLLKLTPDEAFSFVSLQAKLNQKNSPNGVERLLVFGFEPSFFGLNLQVQKYKPFHFYESGFLFSDSLSVLEKDNALKGALWKGMQELFGIGK